jgi:crotonobetainyl-CoA:carnitine CoA-transferase CaiB-like acyl-CoA transferase
MTHPGEPSIGPLDGILVADCSTVLAGPYCTMLLADLGADVIKVEPPEGDGTRGWGPPWVGRDADGTRTAAYFLAVNRNKRSLRLDLRTDEGRTVLRRLLARADVVVENFRVGGFARLGFTDEVLRDINSGLVHLAISGYGPDGPAAGRPGYDFVVQAESGLMSITGDPPDEGGEPTKVGVAIADVVTGLHGTVGILAALAGRSRQTEPAMAAGSARIDTSILESALAVLVNQAQNAFVTGRSPERHGNAHPNIVPYESFATTDGAVAVGVGSERQWPRFCEAIGLAELASDPRFVTNGRRVERRAELRPIIAARMAAASTADWLARLEAAEIPCGAINDLRAAFAAPQAIARGMVREVDDSPYGVIELVGSPIAIDGAKPMVRRPPPLLGQHTDEILAWLGYDDAAVAALHHAGTV